MKAFKVIVILIALAAIITVLSAYLPANLSEFLPAFMQKEEAHPDLSSNISSICELATLECYYHNVATLTEPTTFLGIHTGTKKVWITYSGVVKVGIDAGTVSISEPDANDVVTVSIPKAEIISTDIDEESINEQFVEGSATSRVNIVNKTNAITDAQKTLRESAESDTSLLLQGRNRAKLILEKYIKNVGSQYGKDYTIKWVELE